MKTMRDLVAEHPFFQGLDAAHLQLLAGCAKNVHFDAGQYLAHEGDDADRFYALRLGQVAIEAFAPGRGPMVIETVQAGGVVGWSWLFPPHRWRFDARAVELTRALAFDGACLRGKCEQDPVLGHQFMKRFAGVLIHRLQGARLQLLDIYGPAVFP